MRRWIEAVLSEGKAERIPYRDYIGNDLTLTLVWDPSFPQLKNLIHRSVHHALRCLVVGDSIVVWDAYYVEHTDVCKLLGVLIPNGRLGFGVFEEIDGTVVFHGGRGGDNPFYAQVPALHRLFDAGVRPKTYATLEQISTCVRALTETVTDYTLYHATGYNNAVRILQDNVFLPKTRHGLEGGISLTRSKEFAKHWSYVSFALDGRLLRQRYRIIPTNYWAGSSASERKIHGREEAEEFLVGEIKPADRYITGIFVRNMAFLEREATRTDYYNELLHHPLLNTW